MATRQNLWDKPALVNGSAEIMPTAQDIIRQLAAGQTEVEVGGAKCGVQRYDARMRVLDPRTGEPTSNQQLVAEASLRAIWLECKGPRDETRHISVVEVNTHKYPECPAGTFMATWIRDGMGGQKSNRKFLPNANGRGGTWVEDPDAEPGTKAGQVALGFFDSDGTPMPDGFSLGKEQFISKLNPVF